ncbi:MAG: hypothetical protein HY897_00995 [Deltaproteobacteria bacterium]|nr:hypothetical protein [Deltaproteobacteria bacterium]
MEAPFDGTGDATSEALCTYHDALATVAAESPARVISACRFDLVSVPVALHILEKFGVIISAKMVMNHCPSWLIGQRTYLKPLAGILSSPSWVDQDMALLLQAEKLITLGQLAAGAAHELGNSLSVVSSSLQYLHQRLAAENDPACDFTLTALHNVERMRDLLSTMLDFATVKKPRIEHVDLKKAISEVLRFTSAENKHRQITVNLSFDPSCTTVLADTRGVKQIMLNLIKNAFDALTEGGDTITIRTLLHPADAAAAVMVENNGPSIPPEAMQSLFHPFYTTKPEGTGLGLYLSRLIAKDNDGDLEAVSMPNGMQFKLTLPLVARSGDVRGASTHC